MPIYTSKRGHKLSYFKETLILKKDIYRFYWDASNVSKFIAGFRYQFFYLSKQLKSHCFSLTKNIFLIFKNYKNF